MKHIDEYRDPRLAKALTAGIRDRAARLGRPVRLMEICGSHTHAIGQHGIRSLLPESVRLLSGPGCPVCVTAESDIERCLFLARQPEVIIASFGDMLRVPGLDGASLQSLRAGGADVRIVGSPLDAIELARQNPGRQVVFLGVGFETTAPAVAASLIGAGNPANFSILSLHKLVPPALEALLDDEALAIDGFICPGHVSVITGKAAYADIVSRRRAAVITGFEPIDILAGIHALLGQMLAQDYRVEIQYRRTVRPEGNLKALKIMQTVFEEGPATWRGLGELPKSGLRLRPAYAHFDSLRRFNVPDFDEAERPGCSCGAILKGQLRPTDCPLFGTACTPSRPVGPCMVSSEGACSSAHKYGV
ncbi:MAG: Hydrogenase isoenzymes formation protein HypD [Deltaproteobacteria bacterium ADurb.Bin510]|nr:MAG: Hydrogenase isoenzymes formation protein HypD [Deltaproteobacteria bacterium ADurb.Bin510]